jgi:hypothetical protein
MHSKAVRAREDAALTQPTRRSHAGRHSAARSSASNSTQAMLTAGDSPQNIATMAFTVFGVGV